MITRTYYIKNSSFLNQTLKIIKKNVPCFIEREFIEMDMSKVTIKCRWEDIEYIIAKLAPLF